MIIRRSFLVDNGLLQVAGGVDADSRLYQRMMAKTSKMQVCPHVAQIYYAEREGSVGVSLLGKRQKSEKQKESLPVETWAQQRENEKRFFAK